MNTLRSRRVSIKFIGHTLDEQGQVIHRQGEVIVGDVLAQKQDFVLVRTPAGSYMYVDVSRSDLYTVELQRAAA